MNNDRVINPRPQCTYVAYAEAATYKCERTHSTIIAKSHLSQRRQNLAQWYQNIETQCPQFPNSYRPIYTNVTSHTLRS
jgi:hypothetical protein